MTEQETNGKIVDINKWKKERELRDLKESTAQHIRMATRTFGIVSPQELTLTHKSENFYMILRNADKKFYTAQNIFFENGYLKHSTFMVKEQCNTPYRVFGMTNDFSSEEKPFEVLFTVLNDNSMMSEDLNLSEGEEFLNELQKVEPDFEATSTLLASLRQDGSNPNANWIRQPRT